MNAVILLLLAGIVLIVFEVLTPGMILGILGALFMAGGCGVAFYRFGAGTGSLVTFAAAGVLGLALWLEFTLVPKTRLGRKLFLDQAVDAKSQPAVAEAAAVVGKTCEAVTTLAPSGYVMLDGRRYEAWSQSGHVNKGATLRVVGLDNFRLIVSQS